MVVDSCLMLLIIHVRSLGHIIMTENLGQCKYFFKPSPQLSTWLNNIIKYIFFIYLFIHHFLKLMMIIRFSLWLAILSTCWQNPYLYLSHGSFLKFQTQNKIPTTHCHIFKSESWSPPPNLFHSIHPKLRCLRFHIDMKVFSHLLKLKVWRHPWLHPLP